MGRHLIGNLRIIVTHLGKSCPGILNFFRLTPKPTHVKMTFLYKP